MERNSLIGLAVVLVTVAGLGAASLRSGPDGRTRLERRADRMTDRLIDCPPRIEDRCMELAHRHHADIELLYTAAYRNKPGTAYYLRVNDSTWKLNGRTMTISDRR